MNFLKRSTAFILLFSLMAQTGFAANWYVDTNADNDPDTCVADETDDDADCTLRDAISQAGENDTITFLKSLIITPALTYTLATDNLTIDGDDWGANVNINGATSGVDAFNVTGTGVSLNDLFIYGGFDDGVVVSGDDFAAIGLNVGMDSDGVDDGVDGDGINISGDASTLRNVTVVNSGGNGVVIDGAAGSTFENITVGYNDAGLAVAGNAENGILYQGDLSGDHLLGSADFNQNYIQGNAGDGVRVSSDGTMVGTLKIQGAVVGSEGDGDDTENGGHGLNVQENANNSMSYVIGSDGDGDFTFAEKNTFSGNGGDGIHIESGSSATIMGNYIGVDAAGGNAVNANAGDGIEVDAETVNIGTNNDGTDDSNESNVIGGNDGYGIYVNGDDAVTVNIKGNNIGSTSFGTSGFESLGNALGGIEINSSATSINIGDDSDTATNAQNVIIENGGGIRVVGTGTDATINIKNTFVGVENSTFAFEDPAIVGNNYAGGYLDGIVISLESGTADLNVGYTSVDDTNVKVDIAGHTGKGIEIGDGVKTVDIGGTNVGIAYDFDDSRYDRDAGNGEAGIYINSTDANLTRVTIGGTSAGFTNRIGGNNANGIHIVDAGTVPAAVNILLNVIGLAQDGSTAIGNTGVGLLIADGAAVTVEDNVVVSSSSHGIQMTGGATATFKGNAVGNTLGGTARANVGHGLHINSATTTAVTIGSATDGDGNVFSSSGVNGDGVFVETLASNAATVSVLGNAIGFCANPAALAFTTACANTNGLRILMGAVTIGGDNALGADGTGNLAAANVISNNSADGINLGENVSSATIYGNVIGLSEEGFDTDAGNGGDGIEVNSNVLTSLIIGAVGGVTANTKANAISGNGGQGINIVSVAAEATASIVNNLIGTDWTGNTDLGNDGSGILVADADLTLTVGGAEANQNNIISGNTEYGLYITAATSASILGNYFGVKADGATALANTLYSLYVVSTDSSVGALTVGSADAKNVINNDAAIGVYMKDIISTNELAGTITTDNTWTDEAAAVASYWVRYVADTLKNYAPNGPAECNDGLDNDDDGNTDLDDDGCSSVNDEEEGEAPAPTPAPAATPAVGGSIGRVIGLYGPKSNDDKEEEKELVEETVEEEPVSKEPAEEELVVEEPVEEEVVEPVVVIPAIPFRDQPRPAPQIDREEQVRVAKVNQLDDQVEVSEALRTNVEDRSTQLNLFTQAFSDSETKEELRVDLTEKLKQRVPSDLKVEHRTASGKTRTVTANTKFEFEFDYERAKELQEEADRRGEDLLVLTSYDDLDQDGFSDALEIILELEDVEGSEVDLGDRIFWGEIDLFGANRTLDRLSANVSLASKLFGSVLSIDSDDEKLKDFLPESLDITNLPGYGATVGRQTALWVAGPEVGEEFKVKIVNRNTLEESVIKKAEIDESYKAVVPLTFAEEGDYYIAVEGDSGQSVVRVMVNFDQGMATASLKSGEYLRGNVGAGSLVFVTWESVVMNSVVLADAGQGYYEVPVPKDLPEGNHTVTVYSYNPKDLRFSGILSQLFSK